MDCIGFNYLVMINYSLDLLSSAKIVNLPELTKHFSENFSRAAQAGTHGRETALLASVSACLISVLAHRIAVLACPSNGTAVPARGYS